MPHVSNGPCTGTVPHQYLSPRGNVGRCDQPHVGLPEERVEDGVWESIDFYAEVAAETIPRAAPHFAGGLQNPPKRRIGRRINRSEEARGFRGGHRQLLERDVGGLVRVRSIDVGGVSADARGIHEPGRTTQANGIGTGSAPLRRQRGFKVCKRLTDVGEDRVPDQKTTSGEKSVASPR